MVFKIEKLMLVFLIFIGTPITTICNESRITRLKNTVLTQNGLLTLFVVGITLVATYKMFPAIQKMIKDRINDKIETEIADSLILLCKPNGVINKLQGNERDKQFKKKARLINGRIRILKKLDAIANSADNDLSDEHKKQLRVVVDKSKTLFNSLDGVGALFFMQNPYKHDYKEAGTFDKMWEKEL